MQNDKLSIVLKECGITVFEYFFQNDLMIVYDEELNPTYKIPHYLDYIEKNSRVHPDDHWKAVEMYQGNLRGPVELRYADETGRYQRRIAHVTRITTDENNPYLLGSMRDLVENDIRQQLLEERAQQDSMTKLYNAATGKALVDEYLLNKSPFESCGLIIFDMDYFKLVNDNYGHLFGNEVLIGFANLLKESFAKKDIVIRAGGDEFVAFVKDIGRKTLAKKVKHLQQSMPQLHFSEETYTLTCSIGVCFLPENMGGFTYEQLFENADQALYQAKESGRNRAVFCDTLQHYEPEESTSYTGNRSIDARYMQNDIISSAFEIFEKNSSFRSAIAILLEVIGIRFRLDRITIVRTDINNKLSSKLYNWLAPDAPDALETPSSFTKKDFQTLFLSYDQYGTTVLQHDEMDMYSTGAVNLLIQGNAKTVVYAAMYCDGQYVGAISYVVCKSKRLWSKAQRSQLGEITKIISAHLARSQALNASNPGIYSGRENDTLTGLLSFARFREEVEQMILGGHATSHAMVYTDFENFNHFNQEFGYQNGDELLKDFGNYITGFLKDREGSYFSRVAADQFVLFFQYKTKEEMLKRTREANQAFIRMSSEKYSGARIRLRTGVYIIHPSCTSVAEALDAADYARKQDSPDGSSVRFFDGELERCLKLEYQVSKGFEKALNENQFQVYFQPRFSLKDRKIVGAEAMVRWKREDGTLIYPDEFLNIYEKTGRIIELDFFVFEQVVAFLAKNEKLGRKQVPLSVNASILHAKKEDTTARYVEILEKYGVSPELLELEFTEMDTLSYSTNLKNLLQKLNEARLTAAVDDFGRSYTRLDLLVTIPVNTVKLDRNLLCTCQKSPRGIYLLRNIISLMKGLGNYVVCEGVETEEQAKLLEELGCDDAQGYWLARPMPIEEYEKLFYGEDQS